MTTFLRRHWPKLSTGLLLASLLGVAGFRVYEAHADCCYPGSPCCHPGSACCARHAPPPTT
jgi:hypothetical protein